MRKISLLLVLVLCVTTLFSGCEKSAVNSDVTEITVWSDSAHSKNIMMKLVDEYNKTTGKEKGIKIVYSLKENNLQSLLDSAFAANQAPDLFMGSGKYVTSGLITAIEDIPGGNEYLNEWYSPEEFEASKTKEDGKHYNVWFSTIVSGLIYNKDMLKRYGYVDENGEAVPPKTYDELLEYVKTMTNPQKGDYGIILPAKWGGFFTSDIGVNTVVDSGYCYFNPETCRYDFTGIKPLVETILEIKNNEWCFPGSDSMENDAARAQFAERNIALKYGYSWDVGVLNDQFPAKCDWGVAPIPVADLNNRYKQGMSVDGQFFMNSKSIEEKGADKVFEVFKWLHSDELAIELYKECCIIPYHADVTNVKPRVNKTGWVDFCNIVNVSEVRANGYPVDMSGEKKINDVFMEDIWSGKVSVDDAIKDLNTRYNAALDRALAKEGAISMDLYRDANYTNYRKMGE